MTSTAVGFGNGSNNLTGDPADFFYTTATHALNITGPLTAASLTLTNQFSLTLGDSAANRGFVWAKSGGSASTPGYLRLSTSTFDSYIFACQLGGGICSSASAPSADSNATFQTHVGVDAQAGTTFTIPNSDQDGLITGSNAGATAWTLPCPSAGPPPTFQNGWRAAMKNLGAGTITITTSGCNITPFGSGTAGTTATLTTGQSAFLYSDGANFQMVQ